MLPVLCKEDRSLYVGMGAGSEFEKVRSILYQIVMRWRLKLYSVEMCFVTMRDWKEHAVSVLHSEVCMNFWNLQRVGVLLFLET